MEDGLSKNKAIDGRIANEIRKAPTISTINEENAIEKIILIIFNMHTHHYSII